MDSKPIFFTHVPKTAGTSLHAVFDSVFRHDEIVVSDAASTEAKLYATPFRFLARKRYFGGHFSDRLCEEKIGPALRLTTIREPLERLQSFMNHTLRGGNPHKEAFEAFARGDAAPLLGFLREIWYVSASPLRYYCPETATLRPDPDAGLVERIADHVRSRYDVILESAAVDDFAEAILPASVHATGMHQMDGRTLGPYHPFRSMFGPEVQALLQPDLDLYALLRAAVRGGPADLFAPQPRRVWYLDWDGPQAARGFLKRREAKFALSAQPEFVSRLIAGRVGSIFAEPGFAPVRFSAVMHLSDPGDADRLTLWNGAVPIAFRRHALSPRALFLSGTVPAGAVPEWAFDLSEGRQSANVWLHDFVLYG